MSDAADRRAFDILVRQHHRGVLAYALSLVAREDVAEDLAQEAFLLAYRKLAEFDPTRDFGNWVRGILRFRWLKWLERHRRERALDDSVLAAIDATYERWLDPAGDGGDDALLRLKRCLQRLDGPLGETVRRYYFEDMPAAAIATAMGASDEAVRKRLERARKQLHDCVERGGHA